MVIATMNHLFEQLVRSQNDYDHELKQPRENFSNAEGIYFKVQIQSHFHGYENDGNTYHKGWEGSSYKYLHVLMLYPHSVFTCVSDAHTLEIPQEGWVNTSNHNSCWRTGCDELTQLVFNCHDEAHKNVPKGPHRPRYRTDNVDMRLETSLAGTVFKFVHAEWHYKPDQTSNYFKIIDSVVSIKKTITC